MATTQYQVFCRYYNTNMNTCITNMTDSKWAHSSSTENVESKEIFKFYLGPSNDPAMTDAQRKAEQQQLFIQQQQLQSLIIQGNQANNPKFDMIFVYNGRDMIYSNTNGQMPYILADKMERVTVSPWFVQSTHGSLSSAMTKAQSLINKIGKENVKIGKVIPLEQFIEIV